jgi:hypothetical protein
MKVRATLIELWKKITPYKESDKIFWNGENNNYSEEMERAVSNSPTGARAREMFGKFIFGKGISDDINKKFGDGVLLSEVAKDVVDDVVVQNGAFIHTSYKLDSDENGNPIFLPYQPKSLNYNKCRIGLPDDKGNESMILFKNFDKFDKSVPRSQKNREQEFYPFNPNQKVVKAQIKADAKAKGYEGEDWSEMIKHYRGQVMYLNLTPKYRYAISKFDSVFNDLDTEYRISLYFNTSTRGGFLGKLAVITQGLDGEENINLDEDMSNWLGAEGSADIYHMRVENSEDLDKVLKIINVPSQFNDKQFSVVEPSIKKHILGAANNLPEELAFADSGSMFDSGEKYTALKQFYWEQCEWERQKVEEAFWKLGYNFNFLPINEDLENGNITQ